jgi:hypothetical protein
MKTNRDNYFGRALMALVYALVIGMCALVPPDVVGQVTDTSTGAPRNIYFQGDTIASAATVDLNLATGDFVTVSGTTTITALGTCSAGDYKTVHFSGALTLTHNASSLILPGAANITTAAGDVAQFRSLGSGNWRCVAYLRASGEPVVGQTASASTAIGYTTGAGGTVTQITSATTGVTLNKTVGTVVTVTQNIAAAGEVTFVVTNSAVTALDTVVLNIGADTTSDGTPIATVTAVGAGSFTVTITNLHASTAEQGVLTLNFAVVNGVTS